MIPMKLSLQPGRATLIPYQAPPGGIANITVSASTLVNVYILDFANRSAFVHGAQDFEALARSEALQEHFLTLNLESVGRWFLAVENPSEQDVTVQVNVSIPTAALDPGRHPAEYHPPQVQAAAKQLLDSQRDRIGHFVFDAFAQGEIEALALFIVDPLNVEGNVVIKRAMGYGTGPVTFNGIAVWATTRAAALQIAQGFYSEELARNVAAYPAPSVPAFVFPPGVGFALLITGPWTKPFDDGPTVDKAL